MKEENDKSKKLQTVERALEDVYKRQAGSRAAA